MGEFGCFVSPCFPPDLIPWLLSSLLLSNQILRQRSNTSAPLNTRCESNLPQLTSVAMAASTTQQTMNDIFQALSEANDGREQALERFKGALEQIEPWTRDIAH